MHWLEWFECYIYRLHIGGRIIFMRRYVVGDCSVGTDLDATEADKRKQTGLQ